MNVFSRFLVDPALLFVLLLAGSVQARAEIMVASLADLARVAAQSGQTVRMKPGLYRLAEELPLCEISERRKRGEFHLFTFSGSKNTFHLEGVTIEVDTALRKALRPPIHTDEFLVSGNENTLEGLTIQEIGTGTSMGGAALGITGADNKIRNCTLHVCGSFPYGYGDLFGKGGSDVIAPLKKSGVHITGNGTTLFGCKLYLRSFGHGYYVQEDAANVRFENCSVEGAMRATSEILAETAGPAHDAGFRTVIVNRQGENKILPGYMKSLSEDGFRTYGQHPNLSFKNCTARNMRGGFELRTKTAVHLDNCTAVGNERGFWVSSGAVVQNCQGDAQYGPLLIVEGDNASVELTLLPTESQITVHALAILEGNQHRVTIKPAPAGERSRPLPVLFGYGSPMMGDGMAPIPERSARNLLLRNESAMPVRIGTKASGGEVVSRGPVLENAGKDVKVKPLTPAPANEANGPTQSPKTPPKT